MTYYDPNMISASVCFMAQEKSLAEEQLAMIDRSKLSFNMNIFFSADRNAVLYNSFSQMINEAIDDSEDEFMIFLNPKTKPSAEDLNLLVEKLSTGYCLASIMVFGFWATSKQLIREIGMMDERFISGEWEDGDLILRIMMHDKAIWLGQDWSKYDYFPSKCPAYRGSSLTAFWKKWRLRENSIRYIESREKKISVRHRRERPDISMSWKSWSESWGHGEIWGQMTGYQLDTQEWTAIEEEADIDISYRLDENFNIRMCCEKETAISFFLVRTDRSPYHMALVHSNTWYNIGASEDAFELRLYHDGLLIYINRIYRGDYAEHKFTLPASIAYPKISGQ